MGTFYEDLYDHEGWLASILPDGTETSSYTVGITPDPVGHRPSCGCGWRGPASFDHEGAREFWPPEAVEDELMEAWEAHIREVRAEKALTDADDGIRRAQAALVRAVATARVRGRSWSQIAVVLRVPEQVARDRFARSVDELIRRGFVPDAEKT